jgi:ABC-type Mn2+/Zn2+ transport system ATPase subunit
VKIPTSLESRGRPLWPAAPAITVRRLRVDRGSTTALSIDALDVPRGNTALVGPNGSGKSTLLHTIAGLLTPAGGEVTVLGQSPSEARQHIAYVLQAQHASEHLLVTAREVVALARAAVRGPFGRLGPADRSAVDRAMQRLDITDLSRRHLAEMSGGQRQRVFVAQGLAQDAEVLLLDEPVAGLDLASAQAIRTVIDEERAAGRVVIVATHDLDEARRADHVVLLNERVVAAGTPADVLRPDRLREAYGARVLDLGDQTVTIDDGAHHHDHEHHHHDHH